MRSATIWTTAWDTKNKALYYHTHNNRRIRMVDFAKIDFGAARENSAHNACWSVSDNASRLSPLPPGDPYTGEITMSSLSGHNYPRRPQCPCDWNYLGGLDSQDFFEFIDDFFAGNADFNGIDGTDSQDYFEFIECFVNACP